MSSSVSAPTDAAAPHTTSDSPPTRSLIAAVVPLVPAWRLDKSFDYVVPTELESDVEVGALVRMRFGNRRIRGVVLEVRRDDATEGLEPLGGVVTPAPVAPPPLDDLFRWMAERYVVPLGKAFARSVPPRVRVGKAQPGTVEPVATQVVSRYEGGPALLDRITSGGEGVFSFESLPGEDRAALISDLVSAALRAESGGAIVCVPEVLYGSSVLEGLGARFGDVARVDSNVPEMERSRSQLRLSRGHRLGAGGRGAVLAPVPDLRVIVLDEEHHRTYKEDQSPRYDARRVATERARLQGAVCVLVSATPAVETGAAAQRGDYDSVTPTRSDRRNARPLVEVGEKEPDRAISTLLHRRIADALRSGGKVGLLAPARGYARSVWCAQCRRSLRCPRCEAGMNLDRAAGEKQLRCPRCGTTQAAPEICPHCGSSDFRWLGSGSERLAEQLRKAFPRAHVEHVDVTSIGSAAERAGSADIYVTTWIGTKAAVRPDVSLVGVVDADALIRRPHFRSAEQAYQAFVHMAEWAGPQAAGGRLVIQSDEPNHYVLQALIRGDYRYFLERELEQREELRYPPFCELVRVRASGTDVDATLRQVVEICRKLGARVLGPIKVLVDQREAMEVLIKASSAQQVAAELRVILPAISGETRLSIDVDPR